jgi:hypothetical protein
MMRLLILLGLLFNHLSYAQNKTVLEGKWKIISVQGDDMYLNFKTDSIALYGEFEGKVDKSQAKLFIEPIKASFGECFYLFGSKGRLEIIHNNQLDGTGTYLVDKRKSTITTTVTRNGLIVHEKMAFTVKDKLLHLVINYESEFKLTLEKVSSN